ncbi:MAG: hypothetical protein KBC72_00750 [Acinetobacter sp.]|nr:hypothetical protein [Acinetobacter sp.]
MNTYTKEEVSMQRSKLIKYIRINGYRLIGGIGTFLLGSALFMAWVGDHYDTPMILSAMIFTSIVFCLAIILSIGYVEIFVLKVKKYTDNQVSKTYEQLVNIEKTKRMKKLNN